MVLLIIGVLAILSGGAYVVLNPEALKAPADDGIQTAPGDHPEEDHNASEGVSASAKTSISWKLTDLGERDYAPYTKIEVIINGTTYDAGEHMGHCDTDVGATGGIDGGGLLPGELSARQCWWGGGGHEIGVFAHEDGGYQIMVGYLDEGGAHDPGMRGDFKVRTDIPR